MIGENGTTEFAPFSDPTGFVLVFNISVENG